MEISFLIFYFNFRFKKAFSDVCELVDPVIKQHQETLDLNSMRDFIDVYLQEISKSEPTSSFFGDLGRKSLYTSLFDLFIAGMSLLSCFAKSGFNCCYATCLRL
jgi:hypothetical protein